MVDVCWECVSINSPYCKRKMSCYNSCLWTGSLDIIATNSILNSMIVDFAIGVKLRPNIYFVVEQHLNHWFPQLSHTRCRKLRSRCHLYSW